MYQKSTHILKLYTENLKAKYYLREISKKTKLTLRTTQRMLMELEKEKIIKSKKEGKNKYYSLNFNNYKTRLYLLKSEIDKTLEFINKYKIFNSVLKEDIRGCLVVFGSFAKKNATKNSDLDLLIIGNKDMNIPTYLIPYHIHKIVLTKKQFKRALEKKEPLIIEIIKKHVILKNHDDFIDLIWRKDG